MKQTIYAPNTVPTANIAVNKSRLKVYKNAGVLPTYYLQKGQEFQIEIANPTTDVVLAKVILNGKAISQGGLVLNPGQRVYLERYLDVAKKFLFDTYEVSGSAEMKKAIENNGDIKVEFYRERQPISYGVGTITISDYNYFNSPLRSSTGTPNDFLRNGSSGVLRTSGLFNGTSTNAYYSNSANVNTSFTTSASMDSLSDEATPQPQPIKRLLSRKTKSIETGRVEKGSDSDQKFRTVDKEFDYFPFHTVEYKMLPVSQKINTVSDINVKRYCTQCGAKAGKTDKFCSSCGNKH